MKIFSWMGTGCYQLSLYGASWCVGKMQDSWVRVTKFKYC